MYRREAYVVLRLNALRRRDGSRTASTKIVDDCKGTARHAPTDEWVANRRHFDGGLNKYQSIYMRRIGKNV